MKRQNGPYRSDGETGMTDKNFLPLPKPTLRRLPQYHRFLLEASRKGLQELSATAIAEELQLLPILVRKDLAATGCVGIPKRGFLVRELLEAIENCLGWNRTNEAFLVGVGSLGRALLSYRGFEKNNVEILAGFDIDPEKHKTKVNGKPVFALEQLPDLARRMKVKIGIITVPTEQAQGVADLLVDAGIRAIWNFAPLTLQVSDDVFVQYEDLSASLAVLSAHLRQAGTASEVHAEMP